MLIRIFDIPTVLRTDELKVLVRRAIAEKFWIPTDEINVSFSPIPISNTGTHRVLITGLTPEQMSRYRMKVEVISGACAPYFTTHGYLWYGCQNPNVAGSG